MRIEICADDGNKEDRAKDKQAVDLLFSAAPTTGMESMEPSNKPRLDKKEIEKFRSTLDQHVLKLTLMTDDSRFSSEIAEFTALLKASLPNLKIKREPAGVGDVAGIYIGSGLSCHFIPSGPKLKGFLEAISLSGASITPSKIEVPPDLFENLDLPADLKLYVADGCPHCPKVFSQLYPLPFINSKIRLSVFDPLFFPEKAERDAVKAVPTTLLDNDFRWTGSIDLSELAQVLLTRDPSKLGVGSLDMLLKEGNAESLAEMFQKSGKIFPAFIGLLSHPIWSTRLGAMVVMETLIESDPELAAQIHVPIWKSFESASDPVKGDLLYILGELRCSENTSKFNSIINGNYSEEVKEAANEALAKANGVE